MEWDSWWASPELRADFGKRLRWLREAWRALEGPEEHTQRQWAKTLGVSVYMLGCWESGRTSPGHEQVNRLILLSGCTWDYLYGGILSSDMDPALRTVLARDHGNDLVEPHDWHRHRRAMLTLCATYAFHVVGGTAMRN